MKVLIDKINKFGKFYVLILIICIISLVLEFFGHRHGETSYEDFLFFPAIYGFLSCIVSIIRRTSSPACRVKASLYEM